MLKNIKTNKLKDNMNTMQLAKTIRSNAKIDDLYRKIENPQNQWFALDYILDLLNENQKVEIRRYIKDLIKEEKKTPKINW